MHRRRFLLAGLAGTGAFAGCLGQSTDGSTSSTSHSTTTDTTETTNTTHATGTIDGTNSTAGMNTNEGTDATTTGDESESNRVVTVSNAGTFETGPVTGSLSLRQAKITDTHTAELALSLRNRSSESVTLSYMQSHGLNLITGTRASGDAPLLLVGGDVGWTRTDSCWQPDARTLARGIPDRERSITIDAGGTRQETYHLWSHPENSSCLPRGRYEFTRVFHRNDAKSAWRFTLSLS